MRTAQLPILDLARARKTKFKNGRERGAKAEHTALELRVGAGLHAGTASQNTALDQDECPLHCLPILFPARMLDRVGPKQGEGGKRETNGDARGFEADHGA